MPNFGVGDTPVQISQTGTQEALIQNVGNVPVYLDAYSSVSSVNHGLSIAPLSSVNWGAGRDLWAVCAPGQDSSLTVLYGATGTALSEVSAVVTGDVTATVTGPVDANITNATIPVTGTVDANITNAVIGVSGNVNATIQNASIPVTGTVNANITNANIDATITGDVNVTSGTVNVGGIDTPVMVQGGGSLLLQTTGALGPGTGATHNVPAPASGLTYFGIGVIVRVTGKTVTNDVPLNVYAYNFGFAASNPTTARALLGAGGALNLGAFGIPSTVAMVMPMATAFPLRIDLENTGGVGTGTQNYSITVVGLSYADTFPRDLTQWNNGISVRQDFSNVGGGSYVVIAASMETRQYLLTSVSGTTGNFSIEAVAGDGTWSITQSRAHNSIYAGTPGNEIFANAQSLITIPGDGNPHRVRVNNAVTGNVYLTYLGKIA